MVTFVVMNFLFFLIIFFSSASLLAQTCQSGQHWVRAHHRRAYYKADGTFVSATEVTAHCQGNPNGYSFWASHLTDGRPSRWKYAKEKTVSWTPEEKERVLEAMGDLPEALWGNSINNIYRMKDSLSSVGNPATWAQGRIVLYDSVFDQAHNLAEVLGHELAHEAYEKLGYSGQKAYRDETGWYTPDPDESNDSDWRNDRSKFVEPDGRDSPSEDFANNIQYFLFHPMKLRLFTPGAYEWISHHFGDKFNIRGRK
jgi:hypothetical protein